MKLPSLSSLAGGFLGLVSALLLASCGGGGASGNPSNPGGATLQVLPVETTIYAGVPATFQILGGKPPYLVTSSEATILPVPSTVNGSSFEVLPNNPGVVDTGLPAGALPIRTVTMAVSGSGLTANATVHVAQNFLTGYGVSFSPSACPGPAAPPSSSTPGNFACSGGDTAVRFSAVTNGNLHGNEAFNLSILSGAAILVDPATGMNGSTITVTSDHTGTVNAIIRATPNQPTQLAVLRVQEASTGVYMDTVFTITGNATTSTLTAEPTSFTFTGATTAECGTGSGTVLVFDGVPPYTATSANPALASVTPSTSSAQPGTFTISAGNPGICGNTTIILTDSLGARTTVTVTTAAGSVAPVVPIQLVPNPVTVGCAQSVSVAAIGGSGTYSVTSTDPNILASVAGSIVTVSRAGPAGPGSGGTTNSTVNVTDGATVTPLIVTNPVTCP